MVTLTTITLIAAILVAPYLYFKKKSSIQFGFFPGIMIGSSFSKNELETEDDKIITLSTMQFSLICIMITFVWVADKRNA